jgi:hypothetical protein
VRAQAGLLLQQAFQDEQIVPGTTMAWMPVNWLLVKL